MRSLLNKVFTPRAIQAQMEMVTEKIEKYLSRVDPDGFDAVQEFTGPFPVEVITTMLGVPEEHAQQVRHWIDESSDIASQVRSSSANGRCRSTSNPAMFYYDLVQKRRAEPHRRSFQQAHRRRDRR